MAVDDVYRLSIIAGAPAGQLINTYHFQMKSETEPTESQWAAVAVDCKEIYRVLQATQVVYNMWRAVQVRGDEVSYVTRPCKATGGRLFEAIFTSLTAGGAGAVQMLPPQCAHVTTLRTAQVGRSRRGRIFGFGFCEPDQDAGTWTASITTAVTAAWTTFLAKYGSVSPTDPNFQLGVWSNRIATGCTPNAAGTLVPGASSPSPQTAFAPVTTTVVRNIVRTQRRRVAGVGS